MLQPLPGLCFRSGPSNQLPLRRSLQTRYRGVAPAPRLLRSGGPIRPGHLTNSLLHNGLDSSHLLLLGRLSRPECRAFARFPRTNRAPLRPVNYGDGQSPPRSSAPLSQCGTWRGIRVLPISLSTLEEYVVDGEGLRTGRDPPELPDWLGPARAARQSTLVRDAPGSE